MKAWNKPIFAAACAAIAVCAGTLSGCRGEAGKPAASTQPAATVRLGRSVQSASVLAALTVRQGLFARNGAAVRDQPYVSGQRAMEALLAGEVDAVTAADVPIAIAAFDRDDFRIVAGIAASTGSAERIVARKDRGIARIADLKGRRIATQRGSAVHFFLHVLLARNSLTDKDVQIVFRKAEELPGALAAGEIDAICMREPYVSQAQSLLGEKASVLGDPLTCFRTEHLVVSLRLLRQSPQAVRAMVAAMLQAERLARKDPQAAMGAIAADLGLAGANPKAARAELKMLELRVSLDQYLLVHLENVAEWAIAAGLTQRRTIPNFLDLVDTEFLDSLEPAAVTIIR